MSYSKPATSCEEQIEIWRSRGCEIDDEAFCKEKLGLISYYRLSAYFLPFKKDDNTFESGTTFEKIYHIYEFDRKLRALLFSAIEIIEISLRSRLSNYHALKYGTFGYKNPENFNSRHNPDKFLDTIQREINSNTKVAFVKHYLEKYDGEFPLWVISELFTFGMLSYFYNDLKPADQKIIAKQYNANYKDMVSWLRCCTDLRNICAHYGRLYYRIFSAVPVISELQNREKRRLWGQILAIKNLYPNSEKWNNEFLPQLVTLFSEYEADIELYHLAFPEDWKEKLQK